MLAGKRRFCINRLQIRKSPSVMPFLNRCAVGRFVYDYIKLNLIGVKPVAISFGERK